MQQQLKILKKLTQEAHQTVLQKLSTISILGFVLIALNGCTSTATSQLKESPCRECASKKPFYCNGVWLEESHVS